MTRGLAVVLVCALCGVAAAGDPPTEKQRKEAGELVKKAITKSQAGDHAAAIELYQQANKIAPNAILLSNIGSEYQQMSKPVEALDYFCKYFAADPTGPNVTYATAQAKSLQIQLGNNNFDDKDVCKPAEKKPEAKPPEPTPVTGAAPAEPAAPAAPPEHPGKNLTYAGMGAGAAGVLAFGIGIYFGLKAKSISDSITNHNPNEPWPMDIKTQESDGKSDNTKGIVLMITGGALIAGGAVLFYLGHEKDKEAIVTPTATPTSVGLAVSGRF